MMNDYQFWKDAYAQAMEAARQAAREMERINRQMEACCSDFSYNIECLEGTQEEKAFWKFTINKKARRVLYQVFKPFKNHLPFKDNKYALSIGRRYNK